MVRLTGNDAVFLYSETPTTPMHTLKISIFKEDHVPSLEEAKQAFLSVIHRIPALRWRILPIPFSLHHPVAVEDPEFDIDFHWRHVALPRPGSQREFEDMVAQISSHQLDRRRPLWELWMIEGLEGGRIAFVMKIHHTLADGLASVQLFTRLITEEFDPNPPLWDPQPLPRAGQLLWGALLSHARHDAKLFPEVVRKLIDRYKKLQLYRENREVLAVDSLARDMPHCRFNGALTTQRKFATATLSLATFNSVKDALGGTVNDVVLAVVGGSLRRYLLEHGDSVEQPLIAIIPVSADEPGRERLFGNNFSQMATRLYVRIEDPVERYKKIQESTNAGKSELEIFGKSTIPMLLHYLPPFMYTWLKRREYNKQLARRESYPIIGNVAVSNVPGPRHTLSSGNYEMETLYSVGPLMEGSGLNVTVWSYVDQLNFSIISCQKLVADPHRIARGIEAELAVLLAATGGAGVSPANRSGCNQYGD